MPDISKLNLSQSPINQQAGYAVLVFRDPDNTQLELISMDSQPTRR